MSKDSCFIILSKCFQILIVIAKRFQILIVIIKRFHFRLTFSELMSVDESHEDVKDESEEDMSMVF
jgi:hypothetical protein